MLNTPMDIFKLLKKNNCKDCNEKTCLAFAAAVHQGRKKLSDCPHIPHEVLSKYKENVQPGNSYDESMQEMIDSLKEKLLHLNFAETARSIQGNYSHPWLSVKILGKDFRVNTSGHISTDIHVNPWVVIPFLQHLLQASGAPVSGKWVTFRELKGGKPRLALYEQRFQKEMKRIADNFTDLFEDLIHIFNGCQIDPETSNNSELNQADIALILHPFPKIPILISYWKADSDLSSDINIFFDQMVHEQLDTESLYGLLAGLFQMFDRLSQRHG